MSHHFEIIWQCQLEYLISIIWQCQLEYVGSSSSIHYMDVWEESVGGTRSTRLDFFQPKIDKAFDTHQSGQMHVHMRRSTHANAERRLALVDCSCVCMFICQYVHAYRSWRRRDTQQSVRQVGDVLALQDCVLNYYYYSLIFAI